MHFCIFLWGFTAILGKLISFESGLLVWYRMLFSAIGTFIFLLIAKKFERLRWREFIRISLIGFIVTMHWITFYGAIKASNVSIAISCFSSIALFTSIIDATLHRRLPRKDELLLSIAVMIGIYIIFAFQQLYLRGIILSLCSAFLGALFSVCNKKMLDTHDGGLITFYELSTGFLLLSVLLPLYLHFTGNQFSFPQTNDFIYLLVLSIVCTTLPFTLSLYALKNLDAFTLNLSVNLEPLYSIVLAILIFHENKILNSGFYIGSCIILLSVVTHALLKYKKVKKEPVQSLP